MLDITVHSVEDVYSAEGEIDRMLDCRSLQEFPTSVLLESICFAITNNRLL